MKNLRRSHCILLVGQRHLLQVCIFHFFLCIRHLQETVRTVRRCRSCRTENSISENGKPVALRPLRAVSTIF